MQGTPQTMMEVIGIKEQFVKIKTGNAAEA